MTNLLRTAHELFMATIDLDIRIEGTPAAVTRFMEAQRALAKALDAFPNHPYRG